MTIITGFTSARMLGIENNSVVSGTITGDDLILTRQGGGTINAGDVRGPVGPQGPVGEVTTATLNAEVLALETKIDDDIAAIDDRLAAPGDVKLSMSTGAAPAGWLAFGATYTSADTLYPDLWAAIGTEWKSGTSLVIPSIDDVLLAGGTSAGEAIGSETGLSTNRSASTYMPGHYHFNPHTHSANHNHSGSSSGAGSHWHSGTTSASTHSHTASLTYVYSGGTGSLGLYTGGAGNPLNLTGSSPVSNNGGSHDHAFTTNTHADHSHGVTVNTASVTTGNADSGGGSDATSTAGPLNDSTFSVKNYRLHLNMFIKT